MDPLVVAVILLAVALLLFLIELFVPSGGIIGFLAGAALVGGIVMLFIYNGTVGLIGAIVALAAVPFLFVLAVKLWPNTPVARWLTLKSPVRHRADQPAGHGRSELVGATGKALGDLRPVGQCLINGQRLDCLAEGGVIRKGAAVRVVSAGGMEIKVRAEE